MDSKQMLLTIVDQLNMLLTEAGKRNRKDDNAFVEAALQRVKELYKIIKTL